MKKQSLTKFMIIQKPIFVYKLYAQKWYEWDIWNENNKRHKW